MRYVTHSPPFFKEGMLDEANAEYSRGGFLVQHYNIVKVYCDQLRTLIYTTTWFSDLKVNDER